MFKTQIFTLLCLFLSTLIANVSSVFSDKKQILLVFIGLERGFVEENLYLNIHKHVVVPLQQQDFTVSSFLCAEQSAASTNVTFKEQTAEATRLLNIKHTVYEIASSHRDRIEFCSQELFRQSTRPYGGLPSLSTFSYAVYTRPDLIWYKDFDISLMSLDRVSLRARMLLNCPSLEIDDDYLSWRGCGIEGTGVSNKARDNMQCRVTGMTAEHISACVLPDDQLAVIPNYLVTYYTAVMAIHLRQRAASNSTTGKLLAEIVDSARSERSLLKASAVFNNNMHGTYGLYGKYFEVCKKLGFNIQRMGINSPEGKLLVALEQHFIPFQVTPLPFRLNPSPNKDRQVHLNRFVEHEDWVNAPRKWTC